MADFQQASRPTAARKSGSLFVDGLGALNRKRANRKRKRTRGDSLPSEREVKAAAACGDDATPAALLAVAEILARPSEAPQVFTTEERLRQTLAHLPPPLPLLSQNSVTAAPLASSSPLPGLSMTAMTSTPLMALANSYLDLLKGSPSLQPFSRNLSVQSPSHWSLLNRNLPLLLSSPGGSFNSVNSPIHVTPTPFSSMDPSLNWLSPADELQKLQAAASMLHVPPAYDCKECRRIFSQPDALGGHMSRHRREERRRIRRKKKVEADARKVAESLCQLLKASTSPESSGMAECPADALDRKGQRSSIPAIYIQDEQHEEPSFQAVVASQQELLLYRQFLHHRLSILPDRLLVPPASNLEDYAMQQHEPASRSAAVQENGVCEVPSPGGISGFARMKRQENESLGEIRGALWNEPEGLWSSAEQHQGASGSDSTKHGCSSGSRKLDIDLNLIPASDGDV